MRYAIALHDDGITCGSSCSLEIAIQQHIGVQKEPHGSVHMLGGKRRQTIIDNTDKALISRISAISATLWPFLYNSQVCNWLLPVTR